MKETRSPSQVLFSYLPDQTVDLKGRVWKVREWSSPLPLRIDEAGVKRRVIAAMDPWRTADTDRGIANQLRQGTKTVEVYGINPDQGVNVESWPNTWRCQQCWRVTRRNNKDQKCECGANSWVQLQFVTFHECGYLGAPRLPQCPNHHQAVMNHSGSTSVQDLEFSCPICRRRLQKGLGAGRPCPGCGEPGLVVNVHRAGSVFSSQTFTMVNPARPDALEDLANGDGRERCLHWVLDGFKTERPERRAASRRTVIEGLMAQGLTREVAEVAANAASAAGAAHLDDDQSENLGLIGSQKDDAESSALDLALAMYEGRRIASEMVKEPVSEDFRMFYADRYPKSMQRSGLSDVDYVDRFPVLRGVFGFTRGGKPVGESRLVTFAARQASAIRVYADSNETEAYFLRLDPVRIAKWLHKRKLIKDLPIGAKQARLMILRQAQFPERGADISQETVGSAVLTLLHSYAHRFIRQLAVFAGVDRESLSEYLVPHHLGVFIYAVPRGQFVLGGLQAVFETELHRVLDLQVDAETRCPLDPGCDRSTGACLACLHIGEPSCSHYNRFLDRKTLFGRRGYLNSELQ